MAGKFRVLGDGTRLAIIHALMTRGGLNVGQVVEATGRSPANVSKHLKLMAGANLLARRKDGLQVFYRLNDPVVEKVCRLVCDSIRADAEEELERNRRFLGRGGDLPPPAPAG